MMRILQVVNDMHRAGLETMLMNYYRNIDRNKLQFDFLTHRPNRSDYDDEIESMGGKLYYAPRLYPQNYPKYFKYMKEFWKDHSEYKIVHSHIDSMSYLPLLSAKKAGVPVRIAHSHNTSMDRDFKYLLKQYFRLRIKSAANYYCACGREAGEYLFTGAEYTSIPNAIEEKDFLFNSSVRAEVRNKLRLGSSFTVGHVGRFSYQKNHAFLIEIFEAILKSEPDAKLMLVGTGEDVEKIKNLVKSKGIEDSVLFLGNRNDVNELYQAMDVFVLPSFFEGLPVVGIEAQFSGLPCYFSDRVPKEVSFGKNTHFIKLNSKAEAWAESIRKEAGTSRTTENDEFKNSIYSIKNSAHMLSDLYEKLYAEIK